jgi:hypothetical protein
VPGVPIKLMLAVGSAPSTVEKRSPAGPRFFARLRSSRGEHRSVYDHLLSRPRRMSFSRQFGGGLVTEADDHVHQGRAKL